MSNKILLLMRTAYLNMPGLSPAAYRSARGRRKAALFGLLAVFVVASLLFTSATYSYLLAQSLAPLDALAVLPTLMMFASSILVIMTGAYKAVDLLFNFKDYDQLAALPVSSAALLGSRFALLYVSNLGFCALLQVPALAVYGYMAAPGPAYWIMAVLTLLFIPLLPLILGALIGLVIALVSSRFKYSNITNIILTLAGMLAIMALSTLSGPMLVNAQLGSLSAAFTGQLTRVYFPAGLYARALSGDVLAFLGFSIGSLVLFGGAMALLARGFSTLRSLLQTRRTHNRYDLHSIKSGNTLQALFGKELRRFFASALYVLNGGVGLVLMTIMTVILVFMGGEKLEALLDLPGLSKVLLAALPFLLGLMNAMTSPSACALSLEGKSLSLLKSLPIPTATILLAKASVTVVLTFGATVINALVLTIALHPTLGEGLLLWIIPLLYGLLSAQGGLLFNLAFPNFAWTTEVTVIKQSPPVLLAMLTAFALGFPPLMLLFSLPPAGSAWVGPAWLALLTVINLVLYRVLMGWGVRKFDRL